MNGIPNNVPEVYAATLGTNGRVIKGDKLTPVQAEARRKAGEDVVVCGSNTTTNRQMAMAIEKAANGPCKICPPHINAGPNALPHCQPLSRPPEGHTFYETEKRKAK